MVDTSDIAGLNPFDLVDTESDRVARFFDSADEPTWTKDTRCAGWRVRELLAHLAGVETYHLACLDDDIAGLFEEAGKDGVTDVHSFNDWAVRIRKDRPRDEVLDEWRTKNEEVRRRLRALGPSGTLSSSVGPYPSDLMGFHIASEYATHADDMDVAIDDAERAARTGWRAQVSLFAVKEVGKGVGVERRGNTYVISLGGKSATLSEHDFVEGVTARATGAELDPDLRAALVSLA